MLFSLALIVLCTSTVVFFADEFASLIKKISHIPGVKLFVPLLLVSWLIEIYEDWLLWLLLQCKEGLHYLLHYTVDELFSNKQIIAWVHVALLYLFATLPAWILLLWSKLRNMPKPWSYTYWAGSFIWLIVSVLLSVHRP